MSDKNALAVAASAPAVKPPVDNFERLLRAYSGGVGSLVPAAAAKRILRMFMVEASLNPKIKECSSVSVMRAVFTCAQLGLDPGSVKGEVYLIPRENRKAGCLEVNAQIGYKGYITLARRSGMVSMVDAHVVYEGEKYEIGYGLDPILTHTPAANVDRSDAKIIAAYAVVKLTDKSTYFEWLWRDQIDARRKRSMASGSGPWVTDYAAMARKTAIRALFTGGRVPMADDIGMVSAIDEDASEESRTAAFAAMAQQVRDSGEDPMRIIGEADQLPAPEPLEPLAALSK